MGDSMTIVTTYANNVPVKPYNTMTSHRYPMPWNSVECAAKTATMIVAATVENIESNRRCPSHKPAGLEIPFENCIACTDERRSCATYRVKNAGNTA